MAANGTGLAVKAAPVRVARADGVELCALLLSFVAVAAAVGVTNVSIAGGMPPSHELRAVAFLLVLSTLLGALPFRLSSTVRFPVLSSLLIVTAGMLGGPVAAAVAGWGSGLAGLRRSGLPRGLAGPAGCALGGVLAAVVARHLLRGLVGLPPLVVIGASLCAASVLGLTRIAVDQFVWVGGGSRPGGTAVVYRLAVAGDVLVAGLFASALVGVAHVWGTLALAATVAPLAAGLVVFRWYRERQSRSVAALAGSLSAAEERAQKDGLTDVANRRRFDDALAAEVSRAHRTDTPVALVLLDLDHFKQVNDSYGHPAGDAVLVEAARRLGERTRGGDLVARYGGEEFAVIVADARSELELARTAEALRMAIAGEPFIVADQVLRLTASAGAVYARATEAAALVAAADEALYQAKRQGRDRTIMPSVLRD